MKNPFKTMIAAPVAGRCNSRSDQCGCLCRRYYRRRATFPYPIYAKWADAYKKATGIGLNYQSIGSGGGIAQIKAGHRDLRRYRYAVKAARPRCCWARDVPDGYRRGSACLSSAQRSVEHLGSSTARRSRTSFWQSYQVERPRNQSLESEGRAANMTIIVVHRSDGSGTTFIFANYLSKVSPEWASKVGAATAVGLAGGHRCQRQRSVSWQRFNKQSARLGMLSTLYADAKQIVLHAP